MRRLVSVFKRDKPPPKPDVPPKSPPRPAPITTAIASAPPLLTPRTPTSTASTPQLTDPASHSSGSSSGSASLSIQTPDDDHVTVARSSTKRSWTSWLGPKKHRPQPPPHVSDPATELQSTPFEPPPLPVPHWDPAARPPFLPPAHRPADDTDDTADTSDSDDSSHFVPSPFPAPSSASGPPLARLREKPPARRPIITSLDPSPFVQHADGPLFPRSSNPPHLLSPSPSVLADLLATRMLRRLENPVLRRANPEEASFLLPFASPPAAGTPSPTLSPAFSEPCPPKSTRIFTSSPGLRRWISRPCFEDRYAIYFPHDGALIRRPVTSARAVAALEYSHLIDAMVDPDFDASESPSHMLSFLPWSPVAQEPVPSPDLPPSASSNETLPPPSPSLARTSTYIAVPSPLRNSTVDSAPAAAAPLPVISAAPPPPPATSHSAPTSPTLPPPPPPRPTMPIVQSAPNVKRVVRFAENSEDDEDGLPLYVVRAKKKREEKARFLRQEQLQRTTEQEKERRRQEELEQRQSEELAERERKRVIREQERKEMDRRLYAEEVAAARLRRESTRAGAIPSPNTDSLLLPVSSSSTSLGGDIERNKHRDARRRSQAPQPARRKASDTALLTMSASHSHNHPRDSSSGSSPLPQSRPASTYSHSSSDDVRQAGGSRRSSVAPSAAGSSHRPHPERSRTMPNWGGSNQSLQFIPPVPAVPSFMMHDTMPLLPPTAPFMMMHSSRQRNASPGPSTSSGSRRAGSANSSSERVNQQSRQSSASHRQPSSSTHHSSSSPSPRRPANERRESGDSRRSSMPASQSGFSVTSARSQQQHHSRSQQQQQALSRGRPAHPQQQQYLQPSPWTALPSQNGYPPMMMPVSAYSHPNMATLPRTASGGMPVSAYSHPSMATLPRTASGGVISSRRQTVLS